MDGIENEGQHMLNIDVQVYERSWRGHKVRWMQRKGEMVEEKLPAALNGKGQKVLDCKDFCFYNF